MAVLRRAAENGCGSRLWKFSFFFLRGWVWLTPAGDNPLVTSCSSDAQNCGEVRIFHVAERPFRHFALVGRPKLWWNANFHVADATPLLFTKAFFLFLVIVALQHRIFSGQYTDLAPSLLHAFRAWPACSCLKIGLPTFCCELEAWKSISAHPKVLVVCISSVKAIVSLRPFLSLDVVRHENERSMCGSKPSSCLTENTFNLFQMIWKCVGQLRSLEASSRELHINRIFSTGCLVKIQMFSYKPQHLSLESGSQKLTSCFKQEKSNSTTPISFERPMAPLQKAISQEMCHRGSVTSSRMRRVKATLRVSISGDWPDCKYRILASTQDRHGPVFLVTPATPDSFLTDRRR